MIQILDNEKLTVSVNRILFTYGLSTESHRSESSIQRLQMILVQWLISVVNCCIGCSKGIGKTYFWLYLWWYFHIWQYHECWPNECINYLLFQVALNSSLSFLLLSSSYVRSSLLSPTSSQSWDDASEELSFFKLFLEGV